MKLNTKRYDIRILDPEEFNDARYEINLKEGYQFEDGSHLNYASDYDDLLSLISEIIPEK